MKIIGLIIPTLISASVFAGPVCAKQICTLSASGYVHADDNTYFFNLTVDDRNVDAINNLLVSAPYDDGSGYGYAPDLAKTEAVRATLNKEAQQLLTAGVCAVILDHLPTKEDLETAAKFGDL